MRRRQQVVERQVVGARAEVQVQESLGTGVWLHRARKRGRGGVSGVPGYRRRQGVVDDCRVGVRTIALRDERQLGEGAPLLHHAVFGRQDGR